LLVGLDRLGEVIADEPDSFHGCGGYRPRRRYPAAQVTVA
jgi:hypothetical protein